MDESQNNYIERKEPDTKNHLLNDSIYVYKTQENANYPKVTKSRSVVAWGWEKQEEMEEGDCKGTQGNFENNGYVYCNDCGHGFR